MATISENLQTIKSSTDAIKLAIIDKGGTIEGDITTWASAISGISDGGSSTEEEYVFTGTLSYGDTTITITGNLNKLPDTGRNYLSASGVHPMDHSILCYANRHIYEAGSYSLTVDFNERILYCIKIPSICIFNIVGDTQTVIPVKFILQSGSGGSAN